jgi:hypothetical protein
MALIGDRDRDHAAGKLRNHYVDGRLTLEELSERVEIALGARSRHELRAAFTGLPWTTDLQEAFEQGRSFVRAAVRGVALLLLTGTWFLFTVCLLVVFTVTLLFGEVSAAELVLFGLVWLVPTLLLLRLWRKPPRPRALL